MDAPARPTLDVIDSLGAEAMARHSEQPGAVSVLDSARAAVRHGILSAQTRPSGLDRQVDRALAYYDDRAFTARDSASPGLARLAARLRSH